MNKFYFANIDCFACQCFSGLAFSLYDFMLLWNYLLWNIKNDKFVKNIKNIYYVYIFMNKKKHLFGGFSAMKANY